MFVDVWVQISLPNYLMLGEGNRTRAKMAIERIIRMTSSPANKLVKPIYRPDRLRAINVHRNPMERGRRVDSSPDELRMLHYWGTRGQQQDPGAARKMMSRTVEMTSMRDAWSQRIENSLLVFGERDAFSNVTGPWMAPTVVIKVKYMWICISRIVANTPLYALPLPVRRRWSALPSPQPDTSLHCEITDTG